MEHDQDKITHLVHEQDALVTDPRAQVNLRFCHPEEVNTIRLKQLNFKMKYYLKHLFLKTNGNNLDVMD